LALLAITVAPALGQQVATWQGGSGNWSPCPQQGGNAKWDSCKQDQWPNGNWDAIIDGGPVTATGAQIVDLEVESGDTLYVTPGYVFVAGAAIVNKGTISIGPGDGLGVNGNNIITTLSGPGIVEMTDPTCKLWGGNSTSFVVEQPITGQGSITGMNSLSNFSSISANGGNLEIYPGAGGMTNKGSIIAQSGSTLNLVGSAGFNNANGSIQSWDQSSILLQSNISGGTLITHGSGNFTLAPPGGQSLSNLTMDGTFHIPSGASLNWSGNMINNGLFNVQGSLWTNGTVTLSGKGTVLMNSGFLNGSNANPLINQQVIHGGGTFYEVPLTNQSVIRADKASSPLYFNGGTVTNTATIEAMSDATLQIAAVVNNSGGNIEALNGSTVIFTNNFNGSINGGTLTTSGTGTIQSQNGVLDGTVNVPTNAGLLEAISGFDLILQGTINNTGTIALTGTSCITLNQPTTLTGSGKLTMGSSSCIFGAGLAFTNQSTIQGAGSIGDSNPMPITNDGTILANQTSPLLIVPNAAGFTNNGKLIVNARSTLNIDGPFNNLTNVGTLNGGTYIVAGALGFQNPVVTNNAGITLNGVAAEILNGSNNGLTSLAAIGAEGALTLQNGQALITTASLSNAGKITIGANSSLKVGGSLTQTTGVATVDGTLTAPLGLTLQKGSIVGQGTLVAAVTSDSTVTAGDSTSKAGKLTVTGAYAENSTGILNVAIGGTTVGTQYSQLAISNEANLNGTLNIKRINGFLPKVGDTFTILSAHEVKGKFSTVNGLNINLSEHFEIRYTTTDVTLTVV
jgi:hypothetical protein